MVIASWQSRHIIDRTLDAVRRFSPRGTRIVVVDNASNDGSAEWLRTQPVRLIALGVNVGHGAALDLGFLAARTRTVVALDVDAFPISPDWLSLVTTALDSGATVAGAHGGWVLDRLTDENAGVPDEWKHRDFVHPCWFAMRLRRFVWRGHSFRNVQRSDRKLDPGEAICEREHGRLHRLDPTRIRGPGVLGTVFADAVYHNFYGVRYGRAPDPAAPIDGITPEESRQAWDEAVARYLANPATSG